MDRISDSPYIPSNFRTDEQHDRSGRAAYSTTSLTTSLAAVFTPVDNNILDGPFFGYCNYTITLQFTVVKKRNVKNKDKKISKKALTTLSGGESLNCIVQLEESELSAQLAFNVLLSGMWRSLFLI